MRIDNEKVYWRGSPHAIAATMNPSVLMGSLVSAAASHPAFVGFLGKAAKALGLASDTAFLVSWSVAAIVAAATLWAYFSIVTTAYMLTGDRLIIRKGVFVRKEDEVELYRVIDAIQTVNIFQRMIGVGTATVTSTDKTGTVSMVNIKDAGRVRNGLRTLAERCKSRRGVRILE